MIHKINIINNKKGAIPNSISLPIAVIAYLIIFIVFYMIYSLQGLSLEKEIIGQGFDNDYEIILRNYVGSYVTINGEKKLVSDVIYELVDEGNKNIHDKIQEQLESQSKEILNDVGGSHWRMRFYKGNNFEEAKKSIPLLNLDSINRNLGGGYREANLQLPLEAEESLYITFWVFQ